MGPGALDPVHGTRWGQIASGAMCRFALPCLAASTGISTKHATLPGMHCHVQPTLIACPVASTRLQSLPRPVTKLRNLDMDELAARVAADLK